MGDKKLEDGWSDSIDPLIGQGMGHTAENLWDKYNISREEQDEYAISSHLKASAAQKNGWFDEEIVPVEIPATRKTPAWTFDKDETIRHTVDKEKMARLRPAFRKDGTVTAGNSCGLSDGATALVITSRQKAHELGAKPLFYNSILCTNCHITIHHGRRSGLCDTHGTGKCRDDTGRYGSD